MIWVGSAHPTEILFIQKESQMKVLKTALIVCVLFFTAFTGFTPPYAWADAGKFIKTPEYQEVMQTIANLKNPETTADLAPEVIQQKLADLRFQKYILETAESRSNCRNQTGKTIAVYAKSKKSQTAPALYFLGADEAIDDDIECTGIYLPSGSKAMLGGLEQELSAPIAVKFVPGTQLIATADPETGVIDFGVPALSTFKTGETDWPIPSLTAADIEAQTPNAPVD